MKALLNNSIIKKGTVIGWDWFYVVVEITIHGAIHCICDNANNIYSFTSEEILNDKDPHEWLILQPEDFELNHRFFTGLGVEYKHLATRELPYEVIVEVLSGAHDKRFEHWKGHMIDLDEIQEFYESLGED